MLRSVKHMNGQPVSASCQNIGKLEQLYFDDENWAVRYLIVDIGGIFTGRRVLISPAAVEQITDESIFLKISKSQIENSPDIDTAKPVSRQKEEELHDHYTWPYYWVYPGNYNSLGGAIYPGLTYPAAPPPDEEITGEALRREREIEEREYPSHLRATREILGYHIQATDEEIGHIDDFIVDDQQWAIRYFVIDTRNFLPGRKIIIAPQWTKGIDWEEAVVYVDQTRETLKNGPEYDPEAPLDRDFENRLYDYYNRPKYWA